jgi:hypothetical protein
MQEGIRIDGARNRFVVTLPLLRHRKVCEGFAFRFGIESGAIIMAMEQVRRSLAQSSAG